MFFLIFCVVLNYTKITSQTFSTGDKIMAFETDDMLWYQATILETGKLESKIHWEGFSSEYDEWMRNDNMWKQGMPFIVGDKIQGMETDGKWYNLKVLKVNSSTNKYFIHWGGYDDTYDRWISYDSLRLPTKVNYIEAGNFNTKSSSTSSSSSYSSSSSSSMSKSISFNLENKSSGVIKYESDSGGGARSTGTISPGNVTSVRGIVGGKLVINGNLYRTLGEGDNGTRITYK